jgi:hypothetical protein
LKKLNEVIYSCYFPDFDINWKPLEEEYGVNHEAITYIKNKRLPHKEQFLSAFADRVLHFGSKTTSRI